MEISVNKPAANPQEGAFFNEDEHSSISLLLSEIQKGSIEAKNELAKTIYPYMYNIARKKLGRSAGSSLHPTLVVNEAFVRILHSDLLNTVRRRDDLYAAITRLVRNTCADSWRSRNAIKRSGGAKQVSLQENLPVSQPENPEHIDLRNAIDGMRLTEPKQAAVVECRLLGFTNSQTAALLKVSPSTAEKVWRRARIELYKKLSN